MINTKEYSEAAAEVLDIIRHMDDEMIEMIPLDFIKSLKEKKSETYVSKIDFTKEIEENDLKYATKVILTLMYRDYFCDEEEKKELDKILKINADEKSKKYDVELFKNKNVDNEEEKQLIKIEKEENFIKKILHKLFNK